MIGRFFGWIFLLAAGAVLVRDALAWYELHRLALETFDRLWFDLSSDSFGIFRGAVLGTMPWLWRIVIAPILSLWAAPILFIAALVLLWTGRASRRRRH
jgi:hypothetical protein